MNNLCNIILHFYNSLRTISKHALSGQFIKSNLTSLSLKYDSLSKNNDEKDCNIEFDGKSLNISLSPVTLTTTSKRY